MAQKPFLKTAWLIFRKDMQIEWHTGDILSAMGLFAALMLVVFNFAFDFKMQESATFSAGIIWTTIIFSSTLGINRLMSVEQETQALYALIILPVDKGALFLGKCFSIVSLVALLEVLILPVFCVFFNTTLIALFGLALILMLGTLGYAAAGTMIGTMTLSLRLKELLIPMLLFPVSIPVIIAAVEATRILQETGSMAACADMVYLLIAYDLIIGTGSYLLYDYILEE